MFHVCKGTWASPPNGFVIKYIYFWLIIFIAPKEKKLTVHSLWLIYSIVLFSSIGRSVTIQVIIFVLHSSCKMPEELWFEAWRKQLFLHHLSGMQKLRQVLRMCKCHRDSVLQRSHWHSSDSRQHFASGSVQITDNLTLETSECEGRLKPYMINGLFSYLQNHSFHLELS